MVINIEKLEIILVNNDMNFKDLMKKTNLSSGSINKIKKGENVRLKTISKIVKALKIDAQEIIE